VARDRVERVLPGIVGVNGGELVEVPPETAVVIGDIVDPTVGASIKLEGGLSSFHRLPSHGRGRLPSASRHCYSPCRRICTPASPPALLSSDSAIGK